MRSVRVTLLGSGTLIPSDRHTSAAHLLETDGFRCLLDCGAGTLHAFGRYGVEWRDLDAVAVTHFHNDHIGDLPALLFALEHGSRPRRSRPFTVVGPPGLRGRLLAMAEAFGEHVTDPSFPVEVVELGRNDGWEPAAPSLRLDVHPTPHTERSVAHRWTIGGRTVAYTGDTGPAGPELVEFLSGADLLLCEVSLPDDTEMTNHLTPSRAAKLASGARPGLLVTTHVYPMLDPFDVPRLVVVGGYRGGVGGGRDGLVIEIGNEIRVQDEMRDPDGARGRDGVGGRDRRPGVDGLGEGES